MNYDLGISYRSLVFSNIKIAPEYRYSNISFIFDISFIRSLSSFTQKSFENEIFSKFSYDAQRLSASCQVFCVLYKSVVFSIFEGVINKLFHIFTKFHRNLIVLALSKTIMETYSSIRKGSIFERCKFSKNNYRYII